MNGPGQIMGDVVIAPALAPRRITGRARATETASPAELAAIQETCASVSRRLGAVQRLATEVVQQLATQRHLHASVVEQIADAREQVLLLARSAAAERAGAD